MDFTKKPIIIIGANHSGTRVLVEILQRLGSDGGDYKNEWKENKFFLKLHKHMVINASSRGWTASIFDIDFVSSYSDTCKFYDYVMKEIEQNIETAYRRYATEPWHWKCPTSLLFLETWMKVYPDAYFLHIVRNHLSVAESLLKRKQCASIKKALDLISSLENRAVCLKSRNYLCIRFENIEAEINELIKFLPLSPGQSQVDHALSTIRRKIRFWNKKKRIKENLWENYVRSRIKLNRICSRYLKRTFLF